MIQSMSIIDVMKAIEHFTFGIYASYRFGFYSFRMGLWKWLLMCPIGYKNSKQNREHDALHNSPNVLWCHTKFDLKFLHVYCLLDRVCLINMGFFREGKDSFSLLMKETNKRFRLFSIYILFLFFFYSSLFINCFRQNDVVKLSTTHTNW